MLFPQSETVWVLILYPLILALQWWAWGDVLPVTSLNPAVLLIVFMVAVSAFVTPDLLYSLGKIEGMLLGILIFYTVARHSRKRSGWKLSLGLFLLAGIGVAGVGLIATNWLPSKITGLANIISLLPVRFVNLPGAESGINVNELAGALLWAIPLVILVGVAHFIEPAWLGSWNKAGKLHRSSLVFWFLWLIISFIICGSVFILSQSRDGYLAMGATIPILIVLLARGKSRVWIIGVLIVILIAGVIILSHEGSQVVLSQLFDTLPAKYVPFSVNTIYGRAQIWGVAVLAIRDSPLTGLGMNIFRQAVHLMDPAFQNPKSDIAHAHNEILQVALDLGLPGLVGLLALYVAVLRMLMKMICGNGASRLLALGLFGSLLAHFLFGITDAVALGAKPGFLFWWLLALVCGLYGQYQERRVAQA